MYVQTAEVSSRTSHVFESILNFGIKCYKFMMPRGTPVERERATGILQARISAQTVRNRLREIGARPRRHYVGPN